MPRNLRQEQEGQSVVLIALMMVGLVAMLGLAVDGGRNMAERRQSQNASDSAAFAGARALTYRTNNSCVSEIAVANAINQYAIANGISSTADIRAYFINASSTQTGGQISASCSINGGVPSDATGVRVFTRRTFQPFIISVVFGGNSASTETVAAVQSGPMTATSNLMPMTLQDQTLVFDQIYQLFGDKTGPGAFQWLAFNCDSDNPNLIAYLEQTQSSGLIKAGDLICSGPGVMNSNGVKDALDAWLAKPESQRKWIIPIYDYTQGNGSNLKYHIVAFGEFIFTGYNFQGSNKYVEGRFQRYVEPGSFTTPGQCNTDPTNICAIKLGE